MPSITDLLQQGSTNLWLFVPSAVMLGALHGLEPGHSKTMMAAFIIAVRGTILQAVLLGLSAAVSHTAIVWIVALGGQYLGRRWSGEASEPYVQMASAAVIILVALWMLLRTWRERRQANDHHHRRHRHHHGADVHHGHGGHGHDRTHDHAQDPMDLGDEDDAHAREHAADIRCRFEGRTVTTAQIVLFGLTGGLIPCPAAITVLLLCIQLKQLGLGVLLVLCFGIGLAATMVMAGVLAAISVRHVAKRVPGFSGLAWRAPYASAALIICVGVYMGVSGWLALPATGVS